MANNNLSRARQNKKDEFYTQYTDIERELRHYTVFFQNKTVFCNCDDPKISNFFVYFVRNFKTLGLKRLITTCYKNNQPDIFSQNECEKAVSIIYDGGDDNNPDIAKIAATAIPLIGDGDFRSPECIELLKQADVVVTNPPFSLFIPYVSQLIKYDKKFLIIGHQNALHYSEIFPLFRDNKIWLGYGFKGGAAHFINLFYEDYATAGNHKDGMIRVSGVLWFTNIEHKKRHEDLDLYKIYNPTEYIKYDNFDAINVDEVSDIPIDYEGMMGVPDSFLASYNPEQFEIIGIGSGSLAASIGVKKNYRGRTDIAYTKNGVPKCPFSRIIIKRKHHE